jgi:hypothetical protein
VASGISLLSWSEMSSLLFHIRLVIQPAIPSGAYQEPVSTQGTKR